MRFKNNIGKVFSIIGLSLLGQTLFAQNTHDKIRINQLGFYTLGEKIGIVVDTSSTKKYFYILSSSQKDTVFKGLLSKPAVWEYSEEKVRKAVFTALIAKGEYVLVVPQIGTSYPFTIGDKVMAQLAPASIKALYYNRFSIELTEKYAGKWARKMGHPDNVVIVHNSAASSKRPTGTIISCPKGWIDAGDYNKYIVNSGITTSTLLTMYEDFPFYCDTLKLNIPESSNKVPDALDEILWNLRWMLTMQDPEDGGVYHKLTNPGWDGFIMPADATNPRYVVKKGTAAALDFAAVTAQAYRVFSKFKRQLPGLSDSCLNASMRAYDWARKNNNVPYIQSELSDPAIVTGEYPDFNFTDEFFWASAELFVSTGKLKYIEEADLEMALKTNFGLPGWQSVGTLGLYTLAKNADKFKEEPKYEDVNFDAVLAKIVKMAKTHKEHQKESAYGVAMGTEYSNFGWGSNSFCANQGILLLQAYLLTGDKSYIEVANSNLDYLLGRNATTYSFVTGYGEKSPRFPHHRPSAGDGIEDPVPGFMVGGPNPGQEDKGYCASKQYKSNLPARAYMDETCSYASNEVAINWNSPFAYLVNGLEAIRSKNFTLYVKE
jgi:endoglucanase